MRLPQQDAVAKVLCHLPTEHLEELKRQLFREFLEQKWLRPYRLRDRYYAVAIDATQMVSSDHRHCDHCLHMTYNRGTKREKTVWYHYVLEAKLVTEDGLCLSLGMEWIENPEGEYDKQDCERKAAVRLLRHLKKDIAATVAFGRLRWKIEN